MEGWGFWEALFCPPKNTSTPLHPPQTLTPTPETPGRQASFEPLGLTIAVAKDRAIESLMQQARGLGGFQGVSGGFRGFQGVRGFRRFRVYDFRF